MFLRFFLILSFVSCFLTPAAAEAPHYTQARLFSAVEGVGQLKTLQAGVEIKLQPGWKTYWRTPGEAGLAPVFDWAGSDNLKSADILWPAPHRFTAFDIDNFGYGEKVTFPVNVTLERTGQPVTLALKLNLLVCSTLCIPESHRLTLQIPARETIVSADHATLAAASRTIPTTGNENDFSIQSLWLEEGDGTKIYLHANAASAAPFGKDTDLFVEHASFVSVSKPQFSYSPSTQKLHLEALVRSDDPLETLKKTLGKTPLTLTIVDHDRSFERRMMLGGAEAPSAAQKLLAAATDHTDFNILLLAFLGGLILNLMPCVLPVLSLKVLSVLSHGGKDHRIHRWTIFRNFMASAAGILFSFWLMAGALILLKAAGQSIGWGIQFQHPGFLIFLIAVLTVFSASLWGWFDIPLPRFIAKNIPAQHSHEPSLLGHFLTGAFATLLATPCTAPFLGTAVGFALAREAADILIVFTFLGLGLSFPYIALSLSPRIFKYMPIPGQWMVTFKKVLALALALTAVWLVNVLVTVTTQATLDEGWTPFNETLIKPAVDEGRTVIVDITADWCLTCKANKSLVLEQQDIEAALSAPNVLRLQADWTHRDEGIAAFLRRYGRYGIPFNIVYGPGAPEGIILNELLTKKTVMDALTEAAGE